MSDLYQDPVKALAQAAHGAGRLADADGSAMIDNPLCGDRAAIDVRLAADGSIAALGQAVKGCLLCQASASALAAAAPGLRPEQIGRARQGLERMLRASDDGLGPFGEVSAFAALAVFLPLRRHKSRHDCVLLPFRAAEMALDLAGGKSGR